jgi:hypothetical protein
MVTTTAFAEPAFLPVPSEPSARYFLLQRLDSSSSVELLIRVVREGRARYVRGNFDCEKGAAALGTPGDTIREASGSWPRDPIKGGTVAADLWQEACVTGRPPRFAELQRRSASNDWLLAAWKRSEAIRPRRRDGPLRAANITAAEVGEIQSVMQQMAPGAIVNIGGVVAGCPCEDGPSCSAQVWVVAFRPEQSTGLLLSRLGKRWTVGPVQQWWLDYEALVARPGRSAREEDELYMRFPVCPAGEDDG